MIRISRGRCKERAVTVEIQEPVKAIRRKIADIVGPQSYRIWFRNSTQISCSEGFLKVGVPNLFIGGWIEDHFSDAISQAACEVIGREMQVTYAIDPVLFRNQRKSQLNSQAAFIETHAERAMRDTRGKNGVLPAQPRRLKGRLENFVVGPSNRMGYSVAQTVAENPTTQTTPVFFHSACGLGKTHLLHGIANELARTKPEVRWVFASGEEFTNQFLYALRERTLDAFRHRFRDIDLLLIDDVQFIANKKHTQDEFLHTFNTLEAAGKRVILASDAHPKMIGDLSESLINRLMSGMVVRIERPDLATRCEILKRRIAQTQHVVPEPVVHYIAEKIQANIRELDGALLKLLAYASLTKTNITLEIAQQALEDHLHQTGRFLTAGSIEQSVATFFGITPADLHTSRKSRTIALARNAAMYLARKHTDLSLPEIARAMGNKNHTTVLLACRRIGKLMDEDAEVSWKGAAGPQTRKIRELIASQEEQLGR
jgi:chromosomal replication initiator protein